VRVWDLPTRLFHWLLVVALGVMWWTGKAEKMQFHMLVGSLVLGLLVFRILWGFIGGSTARFASFIRGPRAVMSYLNGRAAHVLGHNPLGGWSVAAMLLVLCVQVGLGLFASDEDGIDAGPLSHYVSFERAQALGHYHHLLFNAVLALMALHVAAIAFHALFRRNNLIGPMLHGSRHENVAGQGLTPAPLPRFAAAAAVAVLMVLLLTVWL
jgi:cytochrome b